MAQLKSYAVFLFLVSLTLIKSGSSASCPETESYPTLSCDIGDRATWGCCTVYGDPHFITVDQLKYRFTGTCEYILAQYCKKNDGDFRITADFNPRPVNASQTLVASANVTLDGNAIVLNKTGAYVNNDPGTNSTGSKDLGDGILIWIVRVGHQIILRVQVNGVDQLRVAYDHKFHRLSIYFYADHFSGKICGMCGNYDGEDSNDHDTNSNKRTNSSSSKKGDRKRRHVSEREIGRRGKRMANMGSKIKKFGSNWKLDENCVEPN